jgi:uncharacterized Zn-finger protein
MPFRWCSNKYMCFFCGCPFDESSKLQQHTRSEHENPKLKTVLSFLSIGRVKLDVTNISCKRCPKTFKNLEEFFNHATSVHSFQFNMDLAKELFSFKLSDDIMKCLDCDEKFKFFGTLLRHVHKYHNKSSEFLCEICGQGFVAKANVNNHIKHVHSKSDCDVCHKPFVSKYAMKVHFEKEHNQCRLKCPKCPEVLGSRYLKKRHLALVHDVQSSQHKCDMCSKIFTVRNTLLEHLARVHMKEKSLACEICGFKVFNKELLKRHMVRHNDSRPFQCDICKKSFQRKKTLEFHRRIHTNDKRYSCKDCGKAFVQVTSLKLHVKVHHSNEGWS